MRTRDDLYAGIDRMLEWVEDEQRMIKVMEGIMFVLANSFGRPPGRPTDPPQSKRHNSPQLTVIQGGR